MAKKKTTDKALGQDPFEDLEMDGMAAPTSPEVVTEAETTSAIDELPVQVEAPAAEPVPEEIEAEPEATAVGEPLVEAEALAAELDAAPAEEAEAEPSGEWLDMLTELGLDEPSAEPVAIAEDEDQVLIAVLEEPGAKPASVPSVASAAILDDLVATIDEEIQEAFGSGAMAGLAPEAPADPGAQEQHVIFSLAGTEYAVPMANVAEIERPLDVTPVPNVPDWVLGVANLRGDVVSMVDLRGFLGLEQVGYQPGSRMVVVQSNREDLTTAFIVDRVSGIRYLPVDRIGAPAAPIEDQVAPYLRGVYEHEEHLLVVLNLERLLLSEEMRQFET